MVTVFDVFTEVPYEFITVSRGNVYGNEYATSKTLLGVFKLKSGMTNNSNMEVVDADATLHAHPEDFPTNDYSSLLGQGIKVDGVTYSIEGVSAGTNFDNGKVEHIYMRLQRDKLVEADYGTTY